MRVSLSEFVGLEPCPFCGGRAYTVEQIDCRCDCENTFYSVSCSSCGVVAFHEESEFGAIKAWNTRAERTCAKTAARQCKTTRENGAGTMTTLYEIDNAILAVLQNDLQVDEETGEIVFDVDDLDALQVAKESKLEACACYVKELEAQAEMIKAEEKALAERRKVKENAAKRLRDYIAGSMLLDGTTKLETARVKLSFRKSETLEVLNAEMVPDEFMTVRTEKKPDKKAIKQAIKDGKRVDGCAVYVHNNLQVK